MDPLPQPRTLLCFGHERRYYRDVIVSDREVYASPDVNPETDGPGCVQSWTRLFDIEELAAKLPPEQRPELLVTRIDASLRSAPKNIGALKCPTVLIIGDTHHQPTPIRSCLAYAMVHPHDLVIGEFNRQHLHFLQEAGVKNVRWIPSFTLSPCERTRAETAVHPCCFAGQAGAQHPFRSGVLRFLEAQGTKVHRLYGTREQAADAYSSSGTSLNISLNGDLNLRVFETMAAGGTLLTDRLTPESGLPSLFDDGEHLATFADPFDLKRQIEHFAAHPDQAARIARAGQQRYRERHTPAHKRRQLFDLLLHDKEDPAFALPAPVRPKGATTLGDVLELRIGFYELLQEMHRTNAAVNVLMWPSIDTRFATDAFDLPRLKVTLVLSTAEMATGRSPPSVAGWKEAAVANRIARVDLRGPGLPNARWSIGVCGAVDAAGPTVAMLLGAGVLDAVAVLDTWNNPALALQTTKVLSRMGAHPWIGQPVVMSAAPGRPREAKI